MLRLAFAGLIVFLRGVPAQAVVPTMNKPVAVLRALDKITARVEELDVPIDKPLNFGTLIITVRTCRVTLPEETPEAAAFLEISEFKPGRARCAGVPRLDVRLKPALCRRWNIRSTISG